MTNAVETTHLQPETTSAFETYIAAAEAAMELSAAGTGEFLWASGNTERKQQLEKGEVVAERWDKDKSKEPIAVQNGLIHDWVGAVFVPGRTVQQALALVQNYEEHKNIYKPEVVDSAVVNRDGDNFQIYLRLLKKKIITVVLDTYHDVHYSVIGPDRATCGSRTTRIVEVEHAGTAKETKSEPDAGYGFLWRLNSYWRFENQDNGVFIECRAISLTRDIPAALAWAIKPIVKKLPKDSLVHTLEATAGALAKVAEEYQQPDVQQPEPTPGPEPS